MRKINHKLSLFFLVFGLLIILFFVSARFFLLVIEDDCGYFVQGAATTCYVALHPNLKGVSGKYYVDCNEYTPSLQARNEELGKKLWDFSNKLINQS